MKSKITFITTLFFVFFFSTVCLAHTVRLADGKTVSFQELLTDLKSVRVIFIGEKHDNLQHHLAQLQVIKGLQEEGVDLAVGLEMFRTDSQKALDDWVAGSMPYLDFIKVYHDNWMFWQEYEEIYIYAREKKIPLVGLNISRDITRLVALKGFDALSAEQLEKLPVVQCKVDQPYMEFIKRALGGHELQEIQFKYFCEAQMLWDKVMATNLKHYLDKNPDKTVVVLAGGGHSWKYGIPSQFEEISDIPFRVLLPEIPGRLAEEGASHKDTDYLMLGVEEAPLH
jgi:uncharacterized iron-regulated protein